MPDAVSFRKYIKALMPTLTGQYWYFTAYVILFFFIPLLNHIVNNFTQKQLKTIIVILTVAFSFCYPVIKSIYYKDVFVLNDGYSAWWLMLLYLIGGYIRKYGLFEEKKAYQFALFYLLAVIVTFCSKFGIHLVTQKVFGESKWENTLVNYTSITVLFSAICLLQLFKKICFKGSGRKIIAFLSPLSFSVYIIHMHPLVADNLLPGVFVRLAEYPAPIMTLCVIGVTLAIYLGCSIIDIPRHYLFKIIKIKSKLNRAEEIILGEIW